MEMMKLDGIQKEIERVLITISESENTNWFEQLNQWGMRIHSTAGRDLIKKRKMNTIPHLSQDLTEESIFVLTPREVVNIARGFNYNHYTSDYQAIKMWEDAGFPKDKSDAPIIIHKPVSAKSIRVRLGHEHKEMIVDELGLVFILMPVVPQMNTSSPGDEYVISTIKTKKNNGDLRYMPASLYWIEDKGKVIYGLGTHMHELTDTHKESEFAMTNSYNKALFYRYDVRIPHNTPFDLTTDLPWTRKEE